MKPIFKITLLASLVSASMNSYAQLDPSGKVISDQPATAAFPSSGIHAVVRRYKIFINSYMDV